MAEGYPPLAYRKTHGASVVYDGKLWMIGGQVVGDSANPTDSVVVYDPGTDTYSTKASMDTAAWGGVAVLFGTKIYHIAGNTDTSTGCNANQEYDIATDTWSTKSTAIPANIAHHGMKAATDGTYIYCFYRTYAYRYDPATDGWTQLNSSSEDFSWSSAFKIGSYIYLIGGYDYGTSAATDVIRRFDPSGDGGDGEWNDSYDTAPYAVWGFLENCVYDTDYIYTGFGRLISGGEHDQRNDFYLYEPATTTWTAKASADYEGSAYASGVISGKVYVIGMVVLDDDDENYSFSKQVYDISGNSWTSTDHTYCGNMPLDRGVSYPTGVTFLAMSYPVQTAGSIDTIGIYVDSNISGLRVGTFYNPSGNVYKCRDSVTIGALSAGLNYVDISSTPLEAEAGDFIGGYYTGGSISRSGGGDGVHTGVAGEYMDPDDEFEEITGTLAISLYGMGVDSGGGGAAAKTSSDAGAGADAIAAVTAVQGGEEAGSGSESPGPMSFALPDGGSGVEGVSGRALLTSDCGQGNESAFLPGWKVLFGGDAGHGADALLAQIARTGTDLKLRPDHGRVGLPHKEVNL